MGCREGFVEEKQGHGMILCPFRVMFSLLVPYISSASHPRPLAKDRQSSIDGMGSTRTLYLAKP